VKIDGDLDVEILRWAPSATVEGLRIGNPKSSPWPGDMTHIRKLSVSVKLLPLLKGDVILPVLLIDNAQVALARQEDGLNNWTFRRKSDKPFSLPAIRRFEINNGRLRISDAQRRLVFAG